MSLRVPRYTVPLWARIVWNIGIAVYTAIVGITLLLDARIPDHRWKWIHSPKLLIPLVAGLLVLTLFDTIRRAWKRLTVRDRELLRVQVRNQLASVIVTIAENEGINVSDVGCGIFVVRPAGWFNHRPEQMIRPERVRIPDDLHETKVEFTQGKGAVGQAWEHKIPAHTDWIAINEKYNGRPDYIAKRWEKIPDATKRNFTMAEFIGMVGKYAEVIAVPIIDEGKFLGCIAVDRRWNENDPTARCLLNTERTKKLLGYAAKTLVATAKG